MTVTPEPPDGPEGPDGSDRPDTGGPGDPPPGPEPDSEPVEDAGAPPDHRTPASGPLSDSAVDALFAGIVAGLEPQMRWGLRRQKTTDDPEGRPAPAGNDAAARSGSSSTDGEAAQTTRSDPDQPGRSTPPAAGPYQRRAGDRPTGESPPATADDARPPTGADDRAVRADREALEREIARQERERRSEARRDAADDRAQRRELRRIERAAELAAFEAHQAEIQAARDADQEHYDPPEPPPVPRPRGRALGALLCLAAGLLLLIKPSLVGVAPDAALVLSVLLLFSGAGLLVWGLRARRDSDDDDGAVV